MTSTPSQDGPSEARETSPDPLRDSLAIAAASLRHSELCPASKDMFARCTCGIEPARKILVDRIDSAISDARAKAIDECRAIVKANVDDKSFYEGDEMEFDLLMFERATDLQLAAIRAMPGSGK